MAVVAKTYWYGSSQETGLTYDSTLDWDRSLWASKIAEIPWYSKITDVTLTTTFNSSSATGKHKLRLDDSNSGTSVVLSEGGVSKSDTTKTISITSKTSLVTTSGAQAGTINGDIRFNFYYGSIRVPYNYIVSSISICWSYTHPTYTINASASIGGSISGDIGTFDVNKTSDTKTITATPDNGYKFVKWVDASGNTISTNNSYDIVIYHKNLSSHTTTVDYTAIFEPVKHTVTYKDLNGETIHSSQVAHDTKIVGGLTPYRTGYTFAGWLACPPAIKIDGSVLDSYSYDGSFAHALDKKYKYSNQLSIHVEAYMDLWMDIVNRQIISCTQGGGWGLGYKANTKINGIESHGFEVYTGSDYTGYDLKFGTDGVYIDNKWYSFDIVFSDSTIEIFVDDISKGRSTTLGSSISYNSANTIFVGGEALGDTSSAQDYFKGLISNVFIANQGSKLEKVTGDTVVTQDLELYPIWRIERYTIEAISDGDGIVTGGGEYAYGEQITITATPNPGYKFRFWRRTDGGTLSSSIADLSSFTITATENAAYKAVFAAIQLDVNYDNLFSFARWYESKSANFGGGGQGYISFNTYHGQVILEVTSGNEFFSKYGEDENLYKIDVIPNTTYIFTSELEIEAGTAGQLFVFYYDKNGKALTNKTHDGIYPSVNGVSSIVFTTSSDCYKVDVRFGATNEGSRVRYKKIGLYKKAIYDAYAKNYDRVREDFLVGEETISLMTPSRLGYTFLNWNTAEDGSGVSYTGTATFPLESITLYAQWQKNTSYTSMILVDTNKVKSLLIDTDMVKTVFIDTTKIFG